MELCTTEVGTGFSSSLIPISSLLHYSFKTGEEEKQREGANYKKVDQGKLGWRGMRGRGVMGNVLELSGPREKSAKSALNLGTKYEDRLMSLGWV